MEHKNWVYKLQFEVDWFSIIACLALLLSSIYFAKAQAFKLTKFYLAITGGYFGRMEQNVL